MEPRARPDAPANVPVRPFTAIALVLWFVLSAGLLWIAIGSGWVVAWLAFALTTLMPTMMLLVMAQTPERATARFLHDRE